MFPGSFTLIVATYVILSLGCTFLSGESQVTPANVTQGPTPEPQPKKYVVPAEMLDATPEALCDRLSEIKLMPNKDPNDTDPIYEALIAKGSGAYPCLLERITDATPMPDPRQAPHWQHYAVGDTATFILVRTVGGEDHLRQEKLLTDMLPQPYRKEWKTNGIYAYFNYVSEPQNRKKLQAWWKKWLKENKK